MGDEQKQIAVFLALITFVVVALIATLLFIGFNVLAIVLVVAVPVIFVYMQSSRMVIQLQEYERGIVFHGGRFKKVAGPGWTFLWPFFDTCTVVDMRVRTADVGPQEVVTKENIRLKIDAILYIKVDDPRAAVLNVKDHEKAAVSYIQANLRDVVGKMKTDDVISNIGMINTQLKKGLEEVSSEWGVKVSKVEIQSIELPPEILKAMHYRKEAEQKRLAAVEQAEAKRATIEAVQSAAGKLTQPTLQYMYLQSLERIADGKSNKIIFPLELSNLASTLASKLGMPYSKAEDTVVKEYQELNKEGKKTKSILDVLKTEVEKKKKDEFDF